MAKTREEIEAELKDKELASNYLDEFKDKIGQQLAEHEAFLKRFKPSIDVKHRVDIQSELNAFRDALNGFKTETNRLVALNIPEHIKIETEKTVRFDLRDRTRRFLVIFTLVCLMFTGVSAYFLASDFFEDRSTYKSILSEMQISWYDRYFEEVNRDCPKSSQKAINKLGDYPK